MRIQEIWHELDLWRKVVVTILVFVLIGGLGYGLEQCGNPVAIDAGCPEAGDTTSHDCPPSEENLREPYLSRHEVLSLFAEQSYDEVDDNSEDNANYQTGHDGEEELKITLLKEYVAGQLAQEGNLAP